MSKGWSHVIWLSLIVAAVRGGAEAEDVHIRMREGACFKIALFADLHFGEDAWTEWGPLQDLNSVQVMSVVLDSEQPDLAIYLGDVITANNIMTRNATSYWDQALSPTRQRGIPWCSVFGNHDDAPFEWPLEWFSSSGIPQLRCSSTVDSECSFRGTTRVELMKSEIEKNVRVSYSKSGPKDLWPSVSNYVLEVSDDVAYMYFFDSGGGSYPEIISYHQVQWFKKKSQQVNPHMRVPEILFWHIPTEAYEKVAPPTHDKRGRCIGSIFLEDVAAQVGEMGIMEVVAKRPSIKAIFVGHNHGLDWCCPYKKVWLCFARHTGYGGYGNWSRGARILEINQHPFSLKSWIRMEDGQTHSEVILG